MSLYEYDQNNIFAKILRGEIPCDTVYSNDHVLAFRDIAPQAPVHILLVPRGAYVSIDDFAANALPEALAAFYAALAAIVEQEGLRERGFRCIANAGADGGQEVAHFHMHILGSRPLGPMLSRS